MPPTPTFPNLIISLDWDQSSIDFSGPDTFAAKETIKRCGRAQFLGASRSWRVENYAGSREALAELFPGALIIETGAPKVTLQNQVFLQAKIPPQNISESQTVVEREGAKSVKDFIYTVREAIKSRFPGPVTLYGTISSFKVNPRGQAFLELSDPDVPEDRIRCVIWSNLARMAAPLKSAGFELGEGLVVMLRGSVELWTKGTSVAIEVQSFIADYTVSKIRSLRDETNLRLAEEKLFDLNRAQTLSFLPRKLVAITSGGGTVINDFLAGVGRAQFDFEVLWIKSSVQGQRAKAELLRAIEMAKSIPGVDLLLIFRGGGSPAELGLFNDYEVAKAVCLFPAPVFSAIGHQADQSSVQDVSYRAFGVPKNIGDHLAELIIDRRRVFTDSSYTISFVSKNMIEAGRRQFLNCASAIRSQGRALLQVQKERLIFHQRALPQTCQSRISKMGQALRQPALNIEHRGLTLTRDKARRLQLLANQLQSASSKNFTRSDRDLLAIKNNLSLKTQALLNTSLVKLSNLPKLPLLTRHVTDSTNIRLTAIAELLKFAAPENQLKRGYALLRNTDNKRFVSSAKDLSVGMNLEIELYDTFIDAKAISTRDKS